MRDSIITVDALAARPWLRVVEVVESGGEVVERWWTTIPSTMALAFALWPGPIFAGQASMGKIATDLIGP